MSKSKKPISTSLISMAAAAGLCLPAVVQANQDGAPRKVAAADQSLTITGFTDGIHRDKYVVSVPGVGNTWFAQTGSHSSGAGESGLRTSNLDWCRVRYLYGDNVRIPECQNHFMYSSHLITGLDGTHFELWFSPSSLSYFKIRNQETGLWYAHDGSRNDGKLNTTKDDWCRVIYYHMGGIVKSPDECKDFNAAVTNAMAGNLGSSAQAREVAFLADQLGGLQTPKKLGLGIVGAVVEEGAQLLPQVAARTIDRSWGPLSEAGSGLKNVKLGAANLGVGLGVGVVVDLGVDRAKDAIGAHAKNANAGMIAAEVVTTTVVSSSITTGILLAAGASFNPIAMGVGILLAGGIAAGEEVAKASSDTGIKFEPGFTGHIRYARDINGISPAVFERENPQGTFQWVKCADEGKACNFTGIRSVRYGANGKFSQHAFANGVNCGIAGAGKGQDPASGVLKTCMVQRLNYEMSDYFFAKQADNPAIYMQQGDNGYCLISNMGELRAFGASSHVRIQNQLTMRGTNTGTCEYPNGFYRTRSDATVRYLSGPTRFPGIRELEKVGTRACSVPDMATFNTMGTPMSGVYVLPDGELLFRGRKNMGACTGGVWNAIAGVSATDIADGWALTRTPTNGGFTVIRLNEAETAWETVFGGGVRIGGTQQEPWILNNTGQIYRWNGSSWDTMPGISNPNEKFIDVGHGWAITQGSGMTGNTRNLGYVYRYSPARKAWIKYDLPDLTAIGGTYEQPWALQSGRIFDMVDGKWRPRGGGTDRTGRKDHFLSPHAFTDVASGTAIAAGGIYRWNSTSETWDLFHPHAMSAIAGTYDHPAVIGLQNSNYTTYLLR